MARFRAVDAEAEVVRDLVGYRDKANGLFLLTPGGMEEALSGHALQDIARHLRNQGLLFTNQEKKLQSKHRVAGYRTTLSLYAVKEAVLESPATSSGTNKSDAC
jgi:hypothetical protein